MSYQDYRTRVPQYTDISHHRAPYKNVYMAGFGQFPALTGDIVTTNDKGYLVVSDKYQDQIKKVLESHSVTPLSVQGAKAGALLSSNLMKGENARVWVGNQVSKGNVVFISPATLTLMANIPGSYPPGVDYIWSLEAETPEARSTAKTAVVLAGNPDKKPIGVGTIALLVGGVALGGFFIIRGMKR